MHCSVSDSDFKGFRIWQTIFFIYAGVQWAISLFSFAMERIDF